jgi:hypothetical protein
MNIKIALFLLITVSCCTSKTRTNEVDETTAANVETQDAARTNNENDVSELESESDDREQVFDELPDENEGYKYNYRFGTSGNFGYNYDIEGEDENGQEAAGNIDIQGKYGSGSITDSEGNEKSIEVEWIDNGVLEGTDEDGVSYTFHVEN